MPDTGMRSADPARAAEGLRTLSGPQSRGATGVLDDYDNIKVWGCSLTYVQAAALMVALHCCRRMLNACQPSR